MIEFDLVDDNCLVVAGWLSCVEGFGGFVVCS